MYLDFLFNLIIKKVKAELRSYSRAWNMKMPQFVDFGCFYEIQQLWKEPKSQIVLLLSVHHHLFNGISEKASLTRKLCWEVNTGWTSLITAWTSVMGVFC